MQLSELMDLTRQFMDADGSTRWSDSFVRTALANVYDQEWSNILNAAPYYTFNTVQLAPDANGIIDITDLTTGTGDSAKNFYRILGMNDGNYQYRETRFQDVPLATTTNYLPTYPRLFYRAGDTVQVLPIGTSPTLNITVNWKPTGITSLASDSSTITYPQYNELIVARMAAAELLVKGGAEPEAAAVLIRSAADDRSSMLDDIRRMTISPTFMAYPDLAWEWAAN